MQKVAVVVLLGGVLAAPGLRAAEVTRLPNGNVSVSARGTPLGTMLRQFDAIAPLDTSLVDPKIERATVDLAVQDVPLATALAASFDAAGVSYVVWGSDPAKLRIVAFTGGTSGEVAERQVAKAYTPPAVPTEGYVLPNGMVLPPGISPDDPDVAMIGGPGVPQEGQSIDDGDLTEALAIDPAPGFPEDPNRKP